MEPPTYRPSQPQQKAAFTALLRAGVILRVRVEKTTKLRAPGTLTLKKTCQPRGAWHSPNIAPSTFLSLAPASAKVDFTVPLRVRVTLRVRVEKTKKLRAPGVLQVQKTCQGEHGPPLTLFLHLLSACHLLQQMVAFSAPVSVRVRLRVQVQQSTKPRA